MPSVDEIKQHISSYKKVQETQEATIRDLEQQRQELANKHNDKVQELLKTIGAIEALTKLTDGA